jgi:hypothetical protein
MPDISMCRQKDCPSFWKCYRAQAEPSKRQSYISATIEGDKCRLYWPIKGAENDGEADAEDKT